MTEARGAVVAATMGLVFLAASATAAEPAAPPPPVTVSILSIQATKEAEPSCDPALAPIKEALARSGYNTFRLLKRDSRPASAGHPVECAMAETYALRVEAERADKDNLKMCITWTRTEKDKDGNTKTTVIQRIPLTIRNGKYFLSGGWKLKNGALLGAVAGE